MISGEQDARNRIIKAAIEILGEVTDVDNITVRQIAQRANVGIGLINYHFKTKDNLLSIVVGEVMAKMATSFVTPGNHSELEPVAKLKKMLKELFSFAERHEKLVQFILTRSILSDGMQTPLFLVPALREIFADRKGEIELRIISLQIILPIQVSSINPSAFHLYSGIDLSNIDQRNSYIDALIDNLIKQ